MLFFRIPRNRPVQLSLEFYVTDTCLQVIFGKKGESKVLFQNVIEGRSHGSDIKLLYSGGVHNLEFYFGPRMQTFAHYAKVWQEPNKSGTLLMTYLHNSV